MIQEPYFVEAEWDPEAGVYFSRTNIPGLVVEADTLEEFEEIAQELTPYLLAANL